VYGEEVGSCESVSFDGWDETSKSRNRERRKNEEEVRHLNNQVCRIIYNYIKDPGSRTS
jgi:hypothetical protein